LDKYEGVVSLCVQTDKETFGARANLIAYLIYGLLKPTKASFEQAV